MTTRRVLFVLPGLHRVDRGAEVAFEAIAGNMARQPGYEVTLIGSGWPTEQDPYEFIHASCIGRERFARLPGLPLMRSEYVYEELTFTPGLLRRYRPADYDATITCSYPFCSWVLNARRSRGHRPVHVYVTQNGDWPAWADNYEYRYFRCDGLVCTNPEYFDRNRGKWNSVLIPNGVDPERFTPGRRDRRRFDLPADAPVALMVSALIPSKRVVEGLRFAAEVEGLHVIVAGRGPLEAEVRQVGRELLGERFQLVSVPREEMPELYRSADLFLHMSLDESSANAYIEALATGLPIVTTDRMVTRWTFEDAAILVDTTDCRAVIEGIEQAFASRRPADIEARRELVDRRFRWSVISEHYVQFIEQLIEGRNDRRSQTP